MNYEYEIHQGVQGPGGQTAGREPGESLFETQAPAGVARDPGVPMESPRRWRANADAGGSDPGESAELRKLRKENAELRRANGILSSASAVAFVTDAYAGRIVGWAVSTSQRTRQLPLIALDQSISRTVRHGDTRGLIHHSDHGTQYISTIYGTHLDEHGILASTGSVGDSCAFALAETVNGAYKTELIHRSKPFETVQALEQATFQWVSRWNQERLHEHLGYQTPAEVEAWYHQSQVAPVTP